MQNGPRARETKQNRKQKRRMCCSNDLKIVTATHPFSLAGTAVKASETDAQPDAAGSVLWGLGSFPNKQGFRVTKALLAEEFDRGNKLY